MNRPDPFEPDPPGPHPGAGLFVAGIAVGLLIAQVVTLLAR